jgi:glutathione S-transferase
VEEKIDLFNGESLEPWYLKINPQASAPSLVIGNEKITQSVEIIRWADRQGPPLGGDSVDRAFIDEWLNKVNAWDGNLFAAANTPAGPALKVSTEYKIKIAEANAKKNPDMADVYKEKVSTMSKNLIEDPSNPTVCDENRKQLVALLDEANARLATNKFLAGPAYSMADVIFTPVLYRLHQLKFDGEYLDSRPVIKRYYAELLKRPSYKAVFGTSDNPLASAAEVIPSVGKIAVDKVTGKYNE